MKVPESPLTTVRALENEQEPVHCMNRKLEINERPLSGGLDGLRVWTCSSILFLLSHCLFIYSVNRTFPRGLSQQKPNRIQTHCTCIVFHQSFYSVFIRFSSAFDKFLFGSVFRFLSICFFVFIFFVFAVLFYLFWFFYFFWSFIACGRLDRWNKMINCFQSIIFLLWFLEVNSKNWWFHTLIIMLKMSSPERFKVNVNTDTRCIGIQGIQF